MKSVSVPMTGTERQGITFNGKITAKPSAEVSKNLFGDGKRDELVKGLQPELHEGAVKPETKAENPIATVVAYLQKSRDNALVKIRQLELENSALRQMVPSDDSQKQAVFNHNA